MTNEENFEKEDRRERFKRRRTHANLGNDNAPKRRRTPYKREQIDYLNDKELDEWPNND
jgi:hypothetical protein